MTLKTNKIIVLFGIVLLLIFVGFLREFMFVNINSELADVYYKRFEKVPPSFLYIFNDWNYANLYYFKFLLTAIFTVIYCSITLLGIKFAFNNKKYLKLTILIFAGIMCISFLVYLTGYLGINPRRAYLFSRWMMGFAESPLILMILVPVFMLHMNQSEK